MCGRLFKKVKTRKRKRIALPQILEPSDYRPYFVDGEFFPRPNWPDITSSIEALGPEERPQAWCDLAFIWLQILAEQLGGRYRVDWSEEFILLSSLPPRRSAMTLAMAEHQRKKILSSIDTEGREHGYGFHTLLIFADYREYERYISAFGPDGSEASSGGMFIGTEYYGHIALHGDDGYVLEIVLAHELTHNLLWPSSLPLWLEEGICQTMEQVAANGYFMPVDRRRAEEHREFWPEFGLARFWSGESFTRPEAQELSYELARLLVGLLSDSQSCLAEFIQTANWQDGGFAAAENVLGIDLSEAIAGFLGPGQWGFDSTASQTKTE